MRDPWGIFPQFRGGSGWTRDNWIYSNDKFSRTNETLDTYWPVVTQWVVDGCNYTLEGTAGRKVIITIVVSQLQWPLISIVWQKLQILSSRFYNLPAEIFRKKICYAFFSFRITCILFCYSKDNPIPTHLENIQSIATLHYFFLLFFSFY